MAPTVVTVDPTSDDRWARLVARARSDVFHSPGWLRALRDTYDLALEARVLLDGAESPVAGFVYSRIVDLMDPRVVSLPFSDYCDPLVTSNAEWLALTDEMLEAEVQFHSRCLHSDIPQSDSRLAAAGRARWHAIDLARPADQLWDGLHPSARRSIRKARREGVEVRLAEGLDDLRAFFELHLRVRKYKYGLLAQPWPFFEAVWEHLLGDGTGALLLATRGGRLLGGVLYLEWDRTWYYKFNASDPDQLGVRPNDLLVWHGVELAQGRGLTRFDFGATDWDHESLVRFKRKYSTEEGTIQFLERRPAGRSDRDAQARALLPRLTDLFTSPDVPDAVTEQAGEVLYRYFV